MVMLFWIPQGVLNLWIFVQNLHPPRGIPVALSVIAPISNEVITQPVFWYDLFHFYVLQAAEILPVLCYLTYDSRIRTALMEVCVRTKKHKKMVTFVKNFTRNWLNKDFLITT